MFVFCNQSTGLWIIGLRLLWPDASQIQQWQTHAVAAFDCELLPDMPCLAIVCNMLVHSTLTENTHHALVFSNQLCQAACGMRGCIEGWLTELGPADPLVRVSFEKILKDVFVKFHAVLCFLTSQLAIQTDPLSVRAQWGHDRTHNVVCA